jgi:tRNA (mo5U34)-methyltransferase
VQSSVAGAAVLQRRVDGLPFWYHRIELPGGVVTPGRVPGKFAAFYGLPDSLEGKRVLDVGAWDGYWTFEALRRGASEVLAIDDFSDNLGSPAPVHARWETFDLCREAFGYDEKRCRRQERSVYSISEEAVGRFDVVLFFGTLYHLKHPLLGLERAASVCDGELYVESHILDYHSAYRSGSDQGYAGGQMVMEFYPDAQLAGNASNWWAPTLHCLAHMVRVEGFQTIEAWPLTPEARDPLMSRGYVRASRRPDPGWQPVPTLIWSDDPPAES